MDSITARSWSAVAPNELEIITTVLDSCDEVFVWTSCVWFLANTIAKHLHFGLVFPKSIVSKALWFAQMQLCKLRPRCHILFRGKSFPPGNPFK